MACSVASRALYSYSNQIDMAPFTPKQLSNFFFTKIEAEKFKCRCGKVRKQSKASGFQNLVSHIHSAHPNFEELMRTGTKTIQNHFISDYALNVHGWLEWVIVGGHPVSFVDDQLSKKYSNLKPLTRVTLGKYILKLTQQVESNIAKDLPDLFGLILDGWTDLSTSTHYYGIFACYPDKNNPDTSVTPLLGFSPLLDETRLNADNHVELITFVLGVYGKEISNVVFLVGDNENLNPRIASDLGVPLLGCYSHRLNLAVKQFVATKIDLVKKIQEIMKKLSNLKKSAELRKVTNLRPMIQNDTRWDSTFYMLKRYFEN